MQKTTCAACDDSGRLPTSAAELCHGCKGQALLVIARKAANGGQMMQGDRDYYAGALRRFERQAMGRRLTIGVIMDVEDEARAIRVADQMSRPMVKR